ncbi:hypothetical protein GCM10027589_07380 [Actinocorallia lasiicapitis]
MEARLGLVDGKLSDFRTRVLDKNGIKKRHYALDGESRQTHLNDELAAAAVADLLTRRDLGLEDVGMLAAATSIPDLLMPGFAAMVHGRLAEHGHSAPVEILSASGVCVSGAAAMRHAANAVRTGSHRRTVAVASELASVMMRGSRFSGESEQARERVDVPDGFQY